MFELLWLCLIPELRLRLREEPKDECEWGYFVELE